MPRNRTHFSGSNSIFSEWIASTREHYFQVAQPYSLSRLKSNLKWVGALSSLFFVLERERKEKRSFLLHCCSRLNVTRLAQPHSFSRLKLKFQWAGRVYQRTLFFVRATAFVVPAQTQFEEGGLRAIVRVFVWERERERERNNNNVLFATCFFQAQIRNRLVRLDRVFCSKSR